MTPLAARPARESQCGRILRLLERHPNQWILNHSIYAECGSMGALHSRMAELRNRWGFRIECESNRARTRYRLVTTLGEDGAHPPEPPPARDASAAALPSSLNVGEQLVMEAA